MVCANPLSGEPKTNSLGYLPEVTGSTACIKLEMPNSRLIIFTGLNPFPRKITLVHVYFTILIESSIQCSKLSLCRCSCSGRTAFFFSSLRTMPWLPPDLMTLIEQEVDLPSEAFPISLSSDNEVTAPNTQSKGREAWFCTPSIQALKTYPNRGPPVHDSKELNLTSARKTLITSP